MRRNDVRDSLQDGIDLAGPPATAPNGMPILPVLRAITAPHPRLCEYGPCVNYHRYVTQVDAQQPATGAAAVHFETHHYCYPTVGVETVLADLPVTECNRWNPAPSPALMSGDAADRASSERITWRQAFAAARSQWKAERQAELDADAREAEVAQAELDAALAAPNNEEIDK